MNIGAIIFALVAFYVGTKYGQHRAYNRVHALTDEVAALARQVAEQDPSYGLRIVKRDPD